MYRTYYYILLARDNMRRQNDNTACIILHSNTLDKNRSKNVENGRILYNLIAGKPNYNHGYHDMCNSNNW